MPGTSDYNICISALDSSFVPSLEAVSRLIDYLDNRMYLDGPDRDDSRLVMLPSRETKDWQKYAREGREVTLPTVRKRYVHLLHSPTAVENYYKHYGELSSQVENIMPRDTAFVASLGRGTRRFLDLTYLPSQTDDPRPWMQYVVVHLIRGYHGLWDRTWDEAARHKVWELNSVKGFTLMLGCKLNSRVDPPPLETYLAYLRKKPQVQDLLSKICQLVGTAEVELIGQHTN